MRDEPERLPIGWQRPWLAPYRARGVWVQAAFDAGRGCADALNEGLGEGAPVRFVPQSALPAGEAYESFIIRTQSVPTRDNLHDFFNGLAWLHFPAAKCRIHALQAEVIARRGVGATRGTLRDALTVFDENGAVLDAPPALWQALAERDWRRLFIRERALWREARLLVFGHALLEKLTQPRKPITAHVLRGPVAAGAIAIDDAAIARALEPAYLAGKPFVPLPVLGIPDWWPQNQNFSFYDDSDVFRPRRVPEPSPTKPAL